MAATRIWTEFRPLNFWGLRLLLFLKEKGATRTPSKKEKGLLPELCFLKRVQPEPHPLLFLEKKKGVTPLSFKRKRKKPSYFQKKEPERSSLKTRGLLLIREEPLLFKELRSGSFKSRGPFSKSKSKSKSKRSSLKSRGLNQKKFKVQAKKFERPFLFFGRSSGCTLFQKRGPKYIKGLNSVQVFSF